MTYIGLLAGLALLIWLALRGINVVFASLICALVVIVTNQLPLAEALSQHYALGPLGAFTFAGKFFLLFVTGAVFGRVMGESHAAASIAQGLISLLGKERILWIIVISSALLTYGGVVVFVVIFAMYPLGLKLLAEADLPKRLFLGAIALGAGTFTLTALPGTPSIHNVIPAAALGTDLYAGAWLGLFGGALMLILGMWYLERERAKATARGEHFDPGPTDTLVSGEPGDNEYPHWAAAITPLALVLFIIVSPRLFAAVGGGSNTSTPSTMTELMSFASSQPILWPSIALVFGSLVATLMFQRIRVAALQVWGHGTQEAIMPLISTAAVIGFGGVVTQTQGFQQFASLVTESALPPLLSMFASISVVSAITGSASGGLQIFMQTMAPSYLAMGIEPEILHRLVAMASGGFDSLPHCGAVVAMLSITGMTHKGGYKEVAVTTVVIPVVATLATLALYSILS